ncbi:DUF3450 domain-containing protein [Bacterioplanoides sp.]|uniref:DUF3450 domain-containing protein n=1 Tax=Bacterioplanoides sp. TaxID=2066072 RepID=UPI003B5C328A
MKPAISHVSKGLALLGLIGSVLSPSLSVAQDVADAKKEIASSEKAGQNSQQRINSLDDQAQKLLNEYRQIKAEADQLNLYNRQMTRIVGNQEEELASLDRQINEIERTERGILPLMSRMLDNLQQFVELDTPFLPKERATRVALLRDLMTRADVTISEKFRRVLEAYQVEVDYGRNIEAYRGQLDNTSYDFLRIGRVALYRLTNDGQQAWVWSQKKKDWLSLDQAYMRDLRKALKVAQQTAAPELLNLPLPTAAKS